MTISANLFKFKSDVSDALWAYDRDPSGCNLPAKLGPWTGIGVMRSDQNPPSGLSRTAIERGIAANGYQLLRKKTGEAQ